MQNYIILFVLSLCVIFFVVISELEGFSHVHFINDGTTVNGDSATVEFVGIGNFDRFNCDLDGQGLQPCKD